MAKRNRTPPPPPPRTQKRRHAATAPPTPPSSPPPFSPRSSYSAMHGAVLDDDPAEIRRLAADAAALGGAAAVKRATETRDQPYGLTPLHRAVMHGRAECVRQLVKCGADVRTRDLTFVESTPLHDCTDPDVAALLLRAGADPNARNRARWRTPLHVAAAAGRAAVVAALLAHERTDASARDADGLKPLHVAAAAGHAAVVSRLLAAPASGGVGALDDLNRTPLHHAADGGDRNVAELLLACRASVGAQDVDGRTPLDFARDDGMRALLLAGGRRCKTV
jgi:ankyrin repeat protein